MATRRPTKSIRPPFIITVATVAVVALLPACGSDVSSNPPSPLSCPVDVPVAGDACPLPGDRCAFPSSDPCVLYTEAICGNLDQWMISQSIDESCQPPPCPTDIPSAGTVCQGPATCSYTSESTPCGAMPVDATCGSDGAWQVSSATCNPPTPDGCSHHATADACIADASCDWQVPGCGEPPLLAAGCFPQMGCGEGSICPDGTTCQSVVVNPCWDAKCNACGVEMGLCLPPEPK